MPSPSAVATLAHSFTQWRHRKRDAGTLTPEALQAAGMVDCGLQNLVQPRWRSPRMIEALHREIADLEAKLVRPG